MSKKQGDTFRRIADVMQDTMIQKLPFGGKPVIYIHGKPHIDPAHVYDDEQEIPDDIPRCNVCGNEMLPCLDCAAETLGLNAFEDEEGTIAAAEAYVKKAHAPRK